MPGLHLQEQCCLHEDKSLIRPKPARLASLGIKASFSELVCTVFRDPLENDNERFNLSLHNPLANLGNVSQIRNKITDYFFIK